nr:ammonium transporter 1 member like [Tanacetum cinerariifolium]
MASTLLLVVVFLLDLVAFALAVAAEQRRASARIDHDAKSRYCVYESDIATGMGVGALLFLLLSQLLVMFATHCMCFGRALSPGRSRALAVFLFITCWVTFIIAEACLLAGSVRNAYHTKYRTVLSENPPCETLRKGVFGAGAAFVVFTGIVSELYYVFYSKSDEGVIPTRDIGIRMGAF